MWGYSTIYTRAVLPRRSQPTLETVETLGGPCTRGRALAVTGSAAVGVWDRSNECCVPASRTCFGSRPRALGSWSRGSPVAAGGTVHERIKSRSAAVLLVCRAAFRATGKIRTDLIFFSVKSFQVRDRLVCRKHKRPHYDGALLCLGGPSQVDYLIGFEHCRPGIDAHKGHDSSGPRRGLRNGGVTWAFKKALLLMPGAARSTLSVSA